MKIFNTPPQFPKGLQCFLGAIFLLPLFARSQSFSDSTQRNNVIKVDLTSNFWYMKAYNFTYERKVKANQTFSVTAGSQQLKGIGSRIQSDEIETGNATAKGYKIAADYRFYLRKENRFQAPHGVYIGPYFAYHHFKNNWDITIDGDSGPQTGSTEGKFDILNVGLQAGYQFLLGNRWAIDLSFIGASASNYRAQMNIKGDFDLSDTDISQELLDALMARFPLLEDLMEDQSIDQSGKLNNWGMGIRYQIHVGYAFGGGKKKK